VAWILRMCGRLCGPVKPATFIFTRVDRRGSTESTAFDLFGKISASLLLIHLMWLIMRRFTRCVPFSPCRSRPVLPSHPYGSSIQQSSPKTLSGKRSKRFCTTPCLCRYGMPTWWSGVKRIAQSYCMRLNCWKKLVFSTKIACKTSRPGLRSQFTRLTSFARRSTWVATKSTNGRKNPVTKRVRMRHGRPVRLPCVEGKR
jgi:hypothetical protein